MVRPAKHRHLCRRCDAVLEVTLGAHCRAFADHRIGYCTECLEELGPAEMRVKTISDVYRFLEDTAHERQVRLAWVEEASRPIRPRIPHRHYCVRCEQPFNPDGWTYCPEIMDHQYGRCADCIAANRLIDPPYYASTGKEDPPRPSLTYVEKR